MKLFNLSSAPQGNPKSSGHTGRGPGRLREYPDTMTETIDLTDYSAISARSASHRRILP